MTYLHNDAQIFEDAVMLAARQAGIIAPAIEKDYYVTLLLRSLSQKLPYIVFKGGTSLSKCHKIIHRFSEDIDITTDIQLTQGQKKKVKQMIVDSVDELGLSIGNLEDTRSRRDYNCYIINYNSILQTANHNLYPAILLETSYTAISFPTVVLPVYSYIGEMMTKESPDLITAFSMSPFSMKVQDINRTFIDKVFAICDYYLQGKITRHSRHLYDIYIFSRQGVRPRQATLQSTRFYFSCTPNVPSGFNSGFRRNSLQYIPETLPKDRFPCSAVSYRYWNDRTVPMPL